MEQTKYIYSGGLASFEHEDMTKLSEYAKDGWILESLTSFGYKLKKRKPVNVTYSLDYNKGANKEYFSYFEAAGWSHVCSGGNQIHIFSAPKGTIPIYTDKMTVIEKYKIARGNIKKTTLITFIITLFLFLLTLLSSVGKIPESAGDASVILGYIALIVLIFTGLPYIAYSFKINKLRKY